MKIRSQLSAKTLFHKGEVYRADEKGLFEVPPAVGAKLVQQGGWEYFREMAPSQREKFNPSTWRPGHKRLIMDIAIGYNNGYAKSAMTLTEGLLARPNTHVDVVAGLYHTHEHVSESLRRRLEDNDFEMDAFHVIFNVPQIFPRALSERTIGYTMFEATLITESWVDIINQHVERVITPCKQQSQAFRDSGVQVDVHTIPLAVDFDSLPVVERKREDDGYVFGIMGSLTYRKGVDIAVNAFKKAFDDRKKYKEAYLFIKTLGDKALTAAPYLTARELIESGNIIFENRSFSPSELVTEFFQKIDCFVFPTRGEGFGLPPVEAMATGLPVICTNWSGPADYMDSKYSYPLGYKLVDVPTPDMKYRTKDGTLIPKGYPESLLRDGQQWADPDEGQLIELMRHLYENRDEGIKKGAKAAKAVRKRFDKMVVAQQLIDYLDLKF